MTQSSMQEKLMEPCGDADNVCSSHPFVVQELFNHKSQLRSITRLLITNLIGVILTLLTLMGTLFAKVAELF